MSVIFFCLAGRKSWLTSARISCSGIPVCGERPREAGSSAFLVVAAAVPTDGCVSSLVGFPKLQLVAVRPRPPKFRLFPASDLVSGSGHLYFPDFCLYFDLSSSVFVLILLSTQLFSMNSVSLFFFSNSQCQSYCLHHESLPNALIFL